MNKKKTMQLLSIPYIKSIYFSQQNKQRDLKMQKKEAGTTGTSKDSSPASGTCICDFSAKHAALKSKSKDWLTLNQDNVSEWGDMSRRLLFQ